MKTIIYTVSDMERNDLQKDDNVLMLVRNNDCKLVYQ
jgi:hypothetical protein